MTPQRLARFLDARPARRTGGGRGGRHTARSTEGPRTTVGSRGVLITGTVAPEVGPELAALDLPAIALPAQHPADAAAPVGDAAASQDAAPLDAAAEPAAGQPAERRRRPAHVLASALVGTLCLGGLLTSGELPAQAAPSEQATSVAEELGLLRAQQNALTEDEAALRLEEMVASRALREDAEAAAAQAQAAADQAARDAAAAAAAAAAEAARPDVVLPVDGARLTSGFGSRWGTLHAGIDLAAPMHTPEYAVMDGVVLKAGAASGYGLAVYLQHDNGVVTVYGHMDSILVEEGQSVRAGETIALLGNRGRSSGPHLHFEVHLGGMDRDKVDPVAWLREHGVQI